VQILKRRWWLVMIGIIFVAVIGFVAWGAIVPSPTPEVKAFLKPDYEVLVSTDRWLVFRPILYTPSTGFIIYPGGRIDPRAYAPQAHAIAAQGYLVIIVPMPLHLAVFGSERAADVIAQFPEIKKWVIGGHSLGGSMAAAYADKHRDQIQGLVLWASYPAKSNDLSDSAIEATSVYATQDGLVTQKKIDASRALLPSDTTWVEIQGGNHAQFYWDGNQAGDKPATISREAQQAQVVQATLSLLNLVNNSSQ
jgi:Alpha/beta hydrolase family